MAPGSFLKRHTLWLGFAAVLVPLAVLLGLQYRWLVKLERTSAVAHEATLDNYLEAVAAEVQYFYWGAAERALNLPASLFTQERLHKAALHFKKKEVEGAKRLFLVSFVGEEEGRVLFYDPREVCLREPEFSREVQAVYMAVAPWRILAYKGGELETVSLAVEEKDPEHRIILLPITDDASKVVGVAGMVLDGEYFRRGLLPMAIEKSLPEYFSGDPRHAPIVSVRDSEGEIAFATGEAAGGAVDEAERAFSFVFTDWRMGLRSRHATPAEWAKTNFALNIGLSGVLALVLLGGIALALRTASREMRLSQMKSDFVSNVSHELRTPLASVRVFGELLRLGKVESGERVREYGEYIETESQRLTQLINNILDFSSIESGRKAYRFERADLEEIVAETLKAFKVSLRKGGFRLSFHRPPSPLPPARVDAGAIALSLSNLVDNAVKYSDGAKEIEVSLRQEGGFAVISVTDHGIGIPRSEQEKIFERFHRVSTGLVHDVKGSGLGLAIVQHIARAHQGKVTVESRPGEGSTFSLYLPLEGAPEEVSGEVPWPAEGREGLSEV